jgi:tetratricopeptide (TPR) repeat protein
MHETFARWLDDRGEGDELVGTHLERAALDGGEPAERAAREASARLASAGELALLSFDHSAAANLLERAAALLEEEAPARMVIECSLGPALRGVGRLDRAIELLESTASRANVARYRTIELRARVELVLPLLVGERMTMGEAEALLDEALVVLTEADDVLGIARAELTYTNLMLRSNHADSAFAHAERADAAYRRLGRSGQMDNVAVLAAMMGSTTVREATEACERSLARHLDSPRTRAYLLVRLGVLRALGGATADAREASTIARSALLELGEDIGLGTSAALLLGQTEAILGDWARAREIFKQALDYTRDRPQHQEYRAYFLVRLGETELERGDPRIAAALAEEARSLAVHGDLETDVWWRRVAARALSTTGHPRKALRLSREALSIVDTTEDVLLRAGARVDLAQVQLRAGRESEALPLIREALELLDNKGAVLPAEHARARFAELLTTHTAGGAVRAAPPESG